MAKNPNIRGTHKGCPSTCAPLSVIMAMLVAEDYRDDDDPYHNEEDDDHLVGSSVCRGEGLLHKL